MPFAPEVQELIRQVEESSGLPVHVAEDPAMRLRASVTPARHGSPAHWVRFKPGSSALDYLVASQLVFLQRILALPEADRWDIAATPTEHTQGIRTMGLDVFDDGFARNMVGQIITQTRTYPIGFRVDAWLRAHLPGLIPQQDIEIRSQLAENQRALAPEIRSKFPKGIVDANTTMNAAFALFWSGHYNEPRFAIPFTALGYKDRAEKLLAVLDEVSAEPAGDRELVSRWAELLGLVDAFHFKPAIED
jgi:hypothetical protein